LSTDCFLREIEELHRLFSVLLIYRTYGKCRLRTCTVCTQNVKKNEINCRETKITKTVALPTDNTINHHAIINHWVVSYQDSILGMLQCYTKLIYLQ